MGTDLNESLYDQNEVVLNAKKFDSLYKKIQFSSTDDIDEIGNSPLDSKEKSGEDDSSPPAQNEEKKSYTNTVNSKEFREYLKKKGLVLFPTKPNQPPKATPVYEKNVVNEADNSDKKKTVLSRISSIFSKSKTTPKSSESRIPFGDGKSIYATKRVTLEREYSNNSNRPILANNEFFTSHNFRGRKVDEKLPSFDDDDDDQKSSISSVLTAAADDDCIIETPSVIRKNKQETPTHYRHIDLNRSKLYQPRSAIPLHNNRTSHPASFNKVSQLSEDVIKPRVLRPALSNNSQGLNKDQVQAHIPLRRSTERQSLPILKSNRYKPVDDRARTMKEFHYDASPESQSSVSVRGKFTSTPNKDDNPVRSPEVSPVVDPFTFAKIHEIKRKTDEVLMNKTLSFDNNAPMKLNNQSFNRNSLQRASMSEMIRRKNENFNQNTIDRQIQNRMEKSVNSLQQQPPRSQSVLDNMTCYKNSLYGEVTYRQPDGNSTNVIMRRPDSSTLDRKQIMQKIYEYYRKSVNNTPVSIYEQKNLQKRSQSTDTSPMPYAYDNGSQRMIFQKAPSVSSSQNRPNYGEANENNSFSNPMKGSSNTSKNSFSFPTRNLAISESDSEDVRYVIVDSEKLTPAEVARYQAKHYPQYPNKTEKIYDVVYGSLNARSNGGITNNLYANKPNGEPQRSTELYGRVKPRQSYDKRYEMQRPASAMSAPAIKSFSRGTSLQNGGLSSVQNLPDRRDIIFNNQVYRPIAAVPSPLPRSISQTYQPLPTNRNMTSIHQPKRRDFLISESEGSETGEVGRIMQNMYYGKYLSPSFTKT